tara:strand:+ start:185 stop:424 length:240 start_codon:yes stop_codon:yes gene_type:complete
MSKFGDKLKKKAITKVGLKGATKVAGKLGSKVGSRFIPVLGQGLLMVDGMRAIAKADKQAPQNQLKKRAKNKSFAGRKI